MKNQLWNETERMSATNFSTSFKQTYDSFNFCGGACIWFIDAFSTTLERAITNVRRTLSSISVSMKQGANLLQVKVITHLLRRYETDMDITRTNAGIQKFKK